MSPQKQSESDVYNTFQEFLDKHPNPARTAGSDSDAEESVFGTHLAQRFLDELKKKLRQSGADGT